MKISTLAIAISVFSQCRKEGYGFTLCAAEFIHIMRSKFEIVVKKNNDQTEEICGSCGNFYIEERGIVPLKYCNGTCTVIHASEKACDRWIEKDERHKRLEEEYILNAKTPPYPRQLKIIQ
jgi:hypothetical protein